MATIAVDPSRLRLDDEIVFHLTGEVCKVVETDVEEHKLSPWYLITEDAKRDLKVTLRWPDGSRRIYPLRDGIWWHFRYQ